MKYKNKISVIGLGFIGLPLYVQLVSKLKNNEVIGIDKNSKLTSKKFTQLRNGVNPIKSNDILFDKTVKKNSKYKLNLTTNLEIIKKSNIIIVSIGFNLTGTNSMVNLRNVFVKIANQISENTLIILETTVLPGTSKNIILPILKNAAKKRKINFNKIYFSYSFERIMPGKNYLSSLNNHRCYASKDQISKIKTYSFLKSLINIKKNELIFFENLTECETVKVVENSFRALNIAFIDEWTKFSLERNLDLNKILRAIRARETHRNIMNPGLGVGGYCLTKDLTFGALSNKFFKKKNINFPLTLKAKKINENMVKTSFEFIKKNVSILKKKILILGASYKEDVYDLRSSPSIVLYKMLNKYTKKIKIFDPLAQKRNKYNITNKLSGFSNFDLVIFANGHQQIKKISFKDFKIKPVYFDLNNILSKKLCDKLRKNKFSIKVLGDKE